TGPPKLGGTAAVVAVTAKVSLALVVLLPSLELTVSVNRSVAEGPPGDTTTSDPRSDTGIAVIEVPVNDKPEWVSTTVQPEDSPVIVALAPSVSSLSKVVTPRLLSVTLAPPENDV